MEDWTIRIALTLIGVIVTVGMFLVNRLFQQVDTKANANSTNSRFDQALQAIKTHQESCDKKADRLQDTLDKIRSDVADTKTQVAVLTARVDGHD